MADDEPKVCVPLVHPGKAKIIVLSTMAAIVYGVVHDQITARLASNTSQLPIRPYFTQPRQRSSESVGELPRRLASACFLALYLQWFHSRMACLHFQFCRCSGLSLGFSRSWRFPHRSPELSGTNFRNEK